MTCTCCRTPTAGPRCRCWLITCRPGRPVGLYLAALYLREGGPLGTAAVSFGGDDRLVSEYVKAEFLARILQRQRLFLTRTAVLQPMSGSLYETVLELPRVGRSAGRAGPVQPAGPAGQRARSNHPRSVGPDRRRAARSADARQAPVIPRDRRRDVPVTEHHQLASDVHLPEAGSLLTQPGSRPLPPARPA